MFGCPSPSALSRSFLAYIYASDLVIILGVLGMMKMVLSLLEMSDKH